MIRLNFTIPSTVLLRPVEVAACLPYGFCAANSPWPVVWALHCAMESGEMFFDSLYCQEFVDKNGFVIIAPSLGNGYFLNSDYERQGDFLDEMKDAMRAILPLSTQKHANTLMGISMGGFGAVRWALASHDFASVAAISGVFNCNLPPDERLFKNRAQKALHAALKKTMKQRLLDASGITRQDADIAYLLANRSDDFPHIYIYCGEEDYISLPQSMALDKLCVLNNCPTIMELSPGAHNIQFWRKAVQKYLSSLFLKKSESEASVPN